VLKNFSQNIGEIDPWSLTPDSYRVLHRFGQAKFHDGGLILGSSQFLILTQLPPKIVLNSKVVNIDSKIIIKLH